MRSPADRIRGWVPRWWRGDAGLVGRAADLAAVPAVAAYAAVIAARNRAFDAGRRRVHTAPVPVISVGNISVGGAGKTPITAWLARELQHRGRRPAIVLRGYGRDEILVHRALNAAVPVVAGRERIEGARRAAEAGADVVLLDDGFQHRSIARSLDVVLVAAEQWSERRRLLPAGPWREPVSALQRGGVVAVTRKTASAAAALRLAERLPRGTLQTDPVVMALEPDRLTRDDETIPLDILRGQRVLAVATLADPAPFAEQLRRLGAEVTLAAFPDHYEFGADDARDLARRASGATLVTTRKEAVKLVEWIGRAELLVLEQSVRVEAGGEVLEAAVTHALGDR